MTYKMCDKCKRFFPWTPDSTEWSVLIHREEDGINRIYLCQDCTEKLLKAVEDDWRFTHG